MWKIFYIAGLIVLLSSIAFAQDSTNVTLPLQDTTAFKKYDWLPVITYAPESKLNLGALVYRYFRIKNTGPDVPLSYMTFSPVYTTVGQLYVDAGFDFFLNKRERVNGNFYYYKAPDRNYGFGNNPDLLVQEYREKGEEDSLNLNYMRFEANRLGLNISYIQSIWKNTYLGPVFEIENVSNYKRLPSKYTITQDEPELASTEAVMTGWRVGVGGALVYDTRDYVINPHKGYFMRLSQVVYHPYIGSSYSYAATNTEIRRYFNFVSNQVLALRVGNKFRYTLSSGEAVPFFGQSRPNIRGYISGTFADNHAMDFDIEYRIPFWQDDVNAPIYKIWKRLGMVVFATGGQAYGKHHDFDVKDFNYSVCSGVRILFNRKNRLNLRIDYAIGLEPNSDGMGRRQRGFYFNLSEAF
jgi:outer membrane protein assembly factor BamA